MATSVKSVLGTSLLAYETPPTTDVGDIYVVGVGNMKWDGSTYVSVLGTAASKDITTSPTDTTPGRVLEVGDGGWMAPIAIPGATDLNSLIVPGRYNCSNSGVAATLVNSPTTIAFDLDVRKSGANGGGVSQHLTTYTGPRVFVRSYNGSGVWSNWVELYHSGNLQFADNATALARASSTTLLSPASLGFAEQPVKTASAQFVRATNEILMNSIVTDLGLEVGDVIQITGSASNNFTMTVEVVTDANDINVNYAHRNGAGSLSLTNETVTCTVKRIAKWYNAPIGLGQAWVSLSGDASVARQNTTGRPLVIVEPSADAYIPLYVSVDGVTWLGLGIVNDAGSNGVSFVIPNSNYYKNGFTYNSRQELR